MTRPMGSGSLDSSVSASSRGWEESGDTEMDEDIANLLGKGLSVKGQELPRWYTAIRPCSTPGIEEKKISVSTHPR